MGEFVQQFIATLTTFPGNLVYHLVLAFSVAGAFQAAINLWRTSGFPQGRRMVIGLGLLLVARLILFFGAILVGSLDSSSNLLPVIERSVTALSLALIIWLWAFPEPMRSGDVAAGSIALLTVIAALFSLVWWQENAGNFFFNQTWLDKGWEIYSIVILALGIILLLVRHPNSWGVGVAMLAILLTGHTAHLFNPDQGIDIPGSVRLAQMAAFPLLLALPHRFQVPAAVVEPSLQKTEPLIQERVQYSVTPQVFQDILSIGAQHTFPEICQKITETVAGIMLADICLALLPPNENGQIIIQNGYDLIRQKNIPSSMFEAQDVPLLLSAMNRAVPLRLPASSTSRDLFSVGTNLHVGRPGHLLASFISEDDKTPLLGITLLSPYSNRGWSNDDQDFLSKITDSLVQILQRNQQWRLLQENITQNQQELHALKALFEETQIENVGLRAAVGDLSQQTFQEHGDSDISSMDITQQPLVKIKRLRAENLRLEELVEKLLAENETQPESPAIEQLEGEMRLALEEIAILKSKLAKADQELLNFQAETLETDETNQVYEASEQQIEVFISIAQDLRQPMSSIVGYTDLLLGESIGILGALQRKFLERVRASTERMQILLDDLLQVVSIEGDELELNPEMINLGNVIDEAIMATTPQLRDRHIILRVDLPDELPQLQADRDALGQIFFHLLKNAGDASPVEGEVLLRASTHQLDNSQEYVLIQVADQGGGIPIQDLPRVFSRSYRADNPLIEGVGDSGVGLSIAKTLVEAHNGRIWVDTEDGSGSTFSVLIPLLNGNHGEFNL